MFPSNPTKFLQKRKCDAINDSKILQPSRKRNQAQAQPAAQVPVTPKFSSSVDLFFATPEQVLSGQSIKAQNVPIAYSFFLGDSAMQLNLWPIAEQQWQHGRQQAGLAFLKRHLNSRRLCKESSVFLRSWLLYQVGMAELEVGTPKAMVDASGHLRASQSLATHFYPASVALGVCHVLRGQAQEGVAALRRGLMMRDQMLTTGIHLSLAQALVPTDAPRLLAMVVCLLPGWPSAHRALSQVSAAATRQSNGQLSSPQQSLPPDRCANAAQSPTSSSDRPT